VLAPLALWLRQENPTAGLVTQEQLEHWLTEYYHGEEWDLPRGEARQRGRAFLESVQRYSNLLLERGERQYGFLHLTLEEMLAAKGIAQRLDDHLLGLPGTGGRENVHGPLSAHLRARRDRDPKAEVPLV